MFLYRFFILAISLCLSEKAINGSPSQKNTRRLASPVSRGVDTATQLLDGRILLLGPDIANIYDPQTDKQIPIYMDQARPNASYHAFHQATLLDDGDVLISGGIIPENSSCKMQLSLLRYSTKNGQWKAVGKLQHPRMKHSAIMISKDLLLLTGGSIGLCSDSHDEVDETSAELCDIETGECHNVSPPNFGRTEHYAVTFSSQKVLIVGGKSVNGHGSVDIPCEIFDIPNNKWNISPEIKIGGPAASATKLTNGSILIIGSDLDHRAAAEKLRKTSSLRGDSRTGSLRTTGSAAVYDSNLQLIRAFPVGSLPLSEHAVVELPGNRVAVVGGFKEHPQTGQWMPSSRIHLINLNTLSVTQATSTIPFLSRHYAFFVPNNLVVVLGWTAQDSQPRSIISKFTFSK